MKWKFLSPQFEVNFIKINLAKIEKKWPLWFHIGRMGLEILSTVLARHWRWQWGHPIELCRSVTSRHNFGTKGILVKAIFLFGSRCQLSDLQEKRLLSGHRTEENLAWEDESHPHLIHRGFSFFYVAISNDLGHAMSYQIACVCMTTRNMSLRPSDEALDISGKRYFQLPINRYFR